MSKGSGKVVKVTALVVNLFSQKLRGAYKETLHIRFISGRPWQVHDGFVATQARKGLDHFYDEEVQVSEGRCPLRHVAWLPQKCCGVLRSGSLVDDYIVQSDVLGSLIYMVVYVQGQRC